MGIYDVVYKDADTRDFVQKELPRYGSLYSEQWESLYEQLVHNPRAVPGAANRGTNEYFLLIPPRGVDHDSSVMVCWKVRGKRVYIMYAQWWPFD